MRGEQLDAAGTTWSDDERVAFEQPIREQYERQGSPYYSTSRLWDDGVIEPAQTRDVLGLALDVVSRTPIADAPGYGVFRM